jgi:oligopeptide/dipeptide ABC transporter ATP-binding protein
VTAYSHFGRSQEHPPSRPEEGKGCAYRIHCTAYPNLDEESRFLCEQAKPVLQPELGRGYEQDFCRCHFPEAPKLTDFSVEASKRKKLATLGETIFKARNVRKTFKRGGRSFAALQGIQLDVREGETYGLVGESGSGKSTLGLALMALQRAEEGKILYREHDLYALDAKALRAWRQEVRMLFQHPEGVLNSGMTVEQILAEALRPEDRRGKEERRAAIDQALDMVRLDRITADRFPSNLSSGEKQRVTIARALITRPKVLVCDEPVASLDLAIQSQILSLLRGFQDELGLTLLFISHNLDMVKLLADRIGIMYMGRLVEEAPVERFSFADVRHPYSRLLLASAPSMEDEGRAVVLAEYPDVEPHRHPEGCPFRNRCPVYLRDKNPACESEDPPMRDFGEGVSAACHALN